MNSLCSHASTTSSSLTGFQSLPTIYFIRHGEKPPKDEDGNDQIGLSTQGVTRAQGLVQVFGANSRFNIQYILAQRPKKSELQHVFPRIS